MSADAAARSPLAVLLAVLVLGSAAVLGPGAAPAAARPAPIDDCGTIDESGEYVLTRNLTADGDTCIRIEGANVTLDGQGHTIRNGGIDTADETGEGIRVAHLEIRNLRVPDGEIVFAADDGVVEHTVTRGIDVYDVATPVIRYNRITGATEADDRGFPDAPPGGIFVTDAGAKIHHNVIADNGAGILLTEAVLRVAVDRNEIVDNGAGIVKLGSGQVAAHGNVVSGNDAGIESVGGVNAVRNYWGAADGPSSSDPDDPAVDSETGAIATGSGDSVEADRFDPWLTEAPELDAGPDVPAPPPEPTPTPTTTAPPTEATTHSTTAPTPTTSTVTGTPETTTESTPTTSAPTTAMPTETTAAETTRTTTSPPTTESTTEPTPTPMPTTTASPTPTPTRTATTAAQTATTPTTAERTPTATETTVETTAERTTETTTATPRPTTPDTTTGTTVAPTRTTESTATATATEPETSAPTTTERTPTDSPETTATTAPPTTADAEPTAETTTAGATETVRATGTPRTDTATERIGARPTAGTETPTEEGAEATTNATTGTIVERADPLVEDTTPETSVDVPGIPGFGVLGALLAVVTAMVLLGRRE